MMKREVPVWVAVVVIVVVIVLVGAVYWVRSRQQMQVIKGEQVAPLPAGQPGQPGQGPYGGKIPPGALMAPGGGQPRGQQGQ